VRAIWGIADTGAKGDDEGRIVAVEIEATLPAIVGHGVAAFGCELVLQPGAHFEYKNVHKCPAGKNKTEVEGHRRAWVQAHHQQNAALKNDVTEQGGLQEAKF
jgi:hypothetical protein